MSNEARVYAHTYEEARALLVKLIGAGWSDHHMQMALIEGNYATRSGRGVWNISAVWAVRKEIQGEESHGT